MAARLVAISWALTHYQQSGCQEPLMTRRTYERDGKDIESASDVDELVSDKRAGWRASAAKARRRQRRYKKRLTNEIINNDYGEPLTAED